MKIALIGNQNSGKTTTFNALTGSNQYVGNWPGVTVEKKEGRIKGHNDVILTDLPGIYSLSAYSTEEKVSRQYIFNEKPDGIINLVDGSNLERNLFLTTQLLELGIPMVIAFNFNDIVEKHGDLIDFAKLEKALHVKVIQVSALKKVGVEKVADTIIDAIKNGERPEPLHPFSGTVEHALAHIEEAVLHSLDRSKQRWFSVKLFERDAETIESLNISPETLSHIEEDIKAAENEAGDDSKSIITTERFNYISSLLKSVYIKRNAPKLTTSDKIDRIVTNKWLALPIFAAVIFIVYYISISTIGTFLTDFVNDTLFGEWIIPNVSSFLENRGVTAWLQSLITDGIIAGVGAVLGFVPQMMTLFLLLSVLEECGYMSRIAFILDRIFRHFGLSGKSFIPMLIGTGCGVPGIMAARPIENESDRRMTIMTTTFMPCSAKLPVIALIAGSFFSESSFVAPSAYFLGIASVIISGIMLKKTSMFRTMPSPFVLELSNYHLPSAYAIIKTTWDRTWSFIKRAGSVILLSTIAVWLLSSFGVVNGSFRMLTEAEREMSILSYIGRAISWLFIPLGWGEWRMGVANFLGLIAKENIVSSLGVLYGFAEIAENGEEMWRTLKAAFTPIQGYSFLAFNLLCAPCVAAIGAIKREMNSPKWTLGAIGYQCLYAWCIACIINNMGALITSGTFTGWTVLSFAIIALMIFMLVRPYKKMEEKI